MTVMGEPRRERLGDLTPNDAIREGARNPRDYFDKWRERYGDLDLDQEVFVVTFTLGDLRDRDRFLAASSASQVCNAIDKRTGKRCGRAFSDDPQPPTWKPQTVCKCGARRREESMDDIGYTTSSQRALSGEMAAIPAELQDEYTKAARERESHATWEPIHGPAERIATTSLRCEPRPRSPPDRH